MNTQGRIKVFLSYSSHDAATVQKIHSKLLRSEELRELSLDIWLDQTRLKPGQDWDGAIQRELRSADLVIAFASKHTLEARTYVRREFEVARILLTRGVATVLPVLLDNSAVPPDFERIHCLRYSGNDAPLIEAIRQAAEESLRHCISSASFLPQLEQLERSLKKRDLRTADWCTSELLIARRQNIRHGTRVLQASLLEPELLNHINGIWESASKGHFSLSRQTVLWQEMRQIDSCDVFGRFADVVGWRANGRWLAYDEYDFSLAAPPNHFPTLRHVNHERAHYWWSAWRCDREEFHLLF